MPELTTGFIESCVAKLKLLDGFGQATHRQVLEPFPFDQNRTGAVQDAAQRIADFIGLSRYSFVINFCSQEEYVAGHIELRDDVVINAGGIQMRANFGDVCSIKLAETLRPFPSAVLAALAHEITHKYLKVNRVPSGSGAARGFEDEILTDIASVWLGLGKLVLNGCESHSVETNWSGTRTTTTRHTVGYLTRSQFAFVYLLVSTARELSEVEYERGLGPDAVATLRAVRLLHNRRTVWSEDG